MESKFINELTTRMGDSQALLAVLLEWSEANGVDDHWLKLGENSTEIGIMYFRSSDIGPLQIVYDFDLDSHWVLHEQTIASRPGQAIPMHRQQDVKALLDLINLEIPIGHLELRADEERIRYRCGVDFEDGQLSVAMLDNMQGLGRIALAKAFLAVVSVAFANMSPEAALIRQNAWVANLNEREKAEWMKKLSQIAMADLERPGLPEWRCTANIIEMLKTALGAWRKL